MLSQLNLGVSQRILAKVNVIPSTVPTIPSRYLARLAVLAALASTSCFPFIHRGPAVVTRLVIEPRRTTRDSVHIALTVVNRSTDELWLRLYSGGPAVEIRDASGHEHCVPPATPPRIFIGGEVVVQLRVAGRDSVTLRRAISLEQLTDCGPGRFTLTAYTVAVRPHAPGPPWSLTRHAPLMIVPWSGAD